MERKNTTEAALLVLDDTDTKSAYLTVVYQQQVVGEEHDATAWLGPHDMNTEITKHGYVEHINLYFLLNLNKYFVTGHRLYTV